MKDDIDHDMSPKAIRTFGSTPGFSKEPVDVSSELRKRVIETKEWIKPDLLKLPLSHDAPSSSLMSFMNALREMLFYISRVVGAFI